MNFFIATAFILVNFELTLGRYVLLRVNVDLEYKSQEHVLEVQASFRHNACLRCIVDNCKLYGGSPLIIQKLHQRCDKYADDAKYPSKKHLVYCGIDVCDMAASEILASCVFGLNPGFRRFCHD